MTQTQRTTTNLQKHTSKNPIQKILIENFYQTLFSLIEPLHPETILDAGCGEGFSLKRVSSYGIGGKFEGVDYSSQAIRLGKKLFPHLILKRASIYKLPYKNSSFDLVLCTEVLEHLKNPFMALQEILRVSKKYVIVSVPNEPFFMLSNFLRGKNITKLGNDPGHINHWTIISFQKFIKISGAKVKIIKFPFPWIMVVVQK